jgi:hypothetical protein
LKARQEAASNEAPAGVLNQLLRMRQGTFVTPGENFIPFQWMPPDVRAAIPQKEGTTAFGWAPTGYTDPKMQKLGYRPMTPQEFQLLWSIAGPEVQEKIQQKVLSGEWSQSVLDKLLAPAEALPGQGSAKRARTVQSPKRTR